MNSYINGNILLIKFFLAHLSTIRSLPKWMRNPDRLKTLLEEKNEKSEDSFILSMSNATALQYNKQMDELKSKLRNLHVKETEAFSYKTSLMLIFLVRTLCICSAFYGNVLATLLLSAVQFVIAPYSFFVSFALFLALTPPIYASHYIAYVAIRKCAEYLLAGLTLLGAPLSLEQLDKLSLPIDLKFIIVFFTLDQLLCLYCQYLTPSKKFSAKETVIHVLWGFANTKTYHVVLLLHMYRANISVCVWVWLLDAGLQITPRIAEFTSSVFMHWLEIFYHQHRMAHLPRVYDHAHKLHHYLHGTNAFDAHIYGNGLPEEFFFLLLELSLGVFYRYTPASLNRFILQHSVDNKFGHTQKPEDTCGENFHADHHLLHVKNFGIYNCLMDMYFSTASSSDRYFIKPSLYHGGGKELIYDVEKRVEKDQVLFDFKLRRI